MRGLEDEAGRQGGEVDLIRRVPHTQQRYEVLLPHRVGDPLAHQELVRQTPFEGCGVIELEPVDLVSHGARRLQVAGASLEEPVPVFEGRTVLGRRQVTVAVVDRLLQPPLSRRGKNCFCSTLDTHRPHLSQPRPPASLLQEESFARRSPTAIMAVEGMLTGRWERRTAGGGAPSLNQVLVAEQRDYSASHLR